MKSLVFVFVIAVMGLAVSCSLFTTESRRYSLNDPELTPFSAMYEVDRDQFCLTDIDKNAEVEIERNNYGTGGYHVMLHMFSGSVTRTVAFKKRGEEYIWLGEQEVHRSGRKFTTVDGETSENITVTYHKNRYNDFEGFRIRYLGDYGNVRFSNDSFNLTCEDVTPYIEKWDRR